MRRAVALSYTRKVVADIDLENLSAGDHELSSSRAGSAMTRSAFAPGPSRKPLSASRICGEGAVTLRFSQSRFADTDHGDLQARLSCWSKAISRPTTRRRGSSQARDAEIKSTIECPGSRSRTDGGSYGEHFLVLPLVSQAIDQQRYLLSGKCHRCRYRHSRETESLRTSAGFPDRLNIWCGLHSSKRRRARADPRFASRITSCSSPQRWHDDVGATLDRAPSSQVWSWVCVSSNGCVSAMGGLSLQVEGGVHRPSFVVRGGAAPSRMARPDEGLNSPSCPLT